MQKYIHVEETDSTNTHLKKLLSEQSLNEGSVVIADFQTAGKGQRGNGWESEKGKNVMFSMVLYPEMISANEQFILSQFASLAIKDVLNEYTDDISIKWPNDIYWHEKKICGILIENELIEDKISRSIIGIGLNVNQESFVSDAPNPTSLKQITNREFGTKEILFKIISTILSYYEKAQHSQTEIIISNYKSALFRRDGYHLYNDGSIDFVARIRDVQPNGLLVLETQEGEIRKFAFKEVKYKL